MIIERLITGMMQVNTYFIKDADTKKTAVIDPGGGADRIIEKIKNEGLDVQYILITHGHFDHIGALEAVRAYTKAPVYIHENGMAYLQDPVLNLSENFPGNILRIKPDNVLKEGEKIELGNISIEVIHTPGHTLDGVCYYIEDEHVLISGDSLFRREVGRTDFVHGSYEQLLESIKTKLLVLPEDVVVYPGHGESTTIGEERQHNPYVGKMGNLFI